MATFLTALAQSAAAVPHLDLQLVRRSYSESGSLGEGGWQYSPPAHACRHPCIISALLRRQGRGWFATNHGQDGEGCRDATVPAKVLCLQD